MFGFKKENVYPIVGLAAAFFLIPVIELLLSYQYIIPSNALFVLLIGGIAGAVYSTFFSIMEGINLGDFGTTTKKGLIGFSIGFIGGLSGFFVAQLLLTFFENRFYFLDKGLREILINLIKAISWMMIGFFIGFSEGLKKLQFKSALISGLGGMLGGLLGGIIFALLAAILPPVFLRGVLFILLGLGIGIFINLIKGQFIKCELTLLNGKFFEKTFSILENSFLIGKARSNDLTLLGYQGISKEHAKIVRLDDIYKIEDNQSETGLFVNERRLKMKVLKDGDVIRLGDAKILVKICTKNKSKKNKS
ncbi:MAG: FHA domain-containing protein [Spirochaetes bacterium]|nr:FHA domain-containing protein [Spirochaetota bacterium]